MDDIERTHRTVKPGNKSHRAIIIKFRSYRTRNNVFKAKKLLKGSSLVLKQDLTKLLGRAATKWGAKNVWTRDGKKLCQDKWCLYVFTTLIMNLFAWLHHNDRFTFYLLLKGKWITAHEHCNLLDHVMGYAFVRQDRLGRGGGVGIYVNNSLRYKNSRFQFLIPSIQCGYLWVQIILISLWMYISASQF